MKKTVQSIKIKDYSYQLPDSRIAKFPLKKRDQSKLLIYDTGNIEESTFENLVSFLPENSSIVFNNTKVIHARLLFKKESGSQIEIFCLRPYLPSDYGESLNQIHSCSWVCLIGNSKRWKNDSTLSLTIRIDNDEITLQAKRRIVDSNINVVDFSWDGKDINFSQILEKGGKLPIPPYLNRESVESDDVTYQTTYGKKEGSVAAPTAGLHFTEETIKEILKKGISINEISLHVGAGTFLPVKSDTIGGHEMHLEHFQFSKSVLENLIDQKGKLVAVGTTSVRTIESLYYLGCMIARNPDLKPSDFIVDQWVAYDDESPIETQAAIQAILNYMNSNDLEILNAATRIIIAPGFQFRYVDGLITNFHQPESTLLLLIAAFIGEDWRRIYDYALEHDFRFLSYGDSSLLWRRNR